MKDYQKLLLGIVGGVVAGKVLFGTSLGFALVRPVARLVDNVDAELAKPVDNATTAEEQAWLDA